MVKSKATKRKPAAGRPRAAVTSKSSPRQQVQPAMKGSNINLSTIADHLRTLATRPPSFDPYEPVIVEGDYDKYVVQDPYQHMEVNQYLHKTDNTEMALAAKVCITRESLSSGGLNTLSVPAVHRVFWRPPVVFFDTKTDTVLKGDTRGIFSDILSATIRFTNMLSQEIVVTGNSPRGAINAPNSVRFRDFERRMVIKPGASVQMKVHWRDQSNVKTPLMTVLDQTIDNVNVKRPAFELLDYMVEYPDIDRESNTSYLPTTEICRVTYVVNYVVNVNFPPELTFTPIVPFVLAGSVYPTKDLFGLAGVAPSKLLSLRGNTAPKWVSLSESTRPVVAMLREGDFGHLLYLAGAEADLSQPLPLQLGSFCSPDYRLMVPGLSATAPLDPTPSDPHAWRVVSLFGYSSQRRKWYLWDEFNNCPQNFANDSAWDKIGDQNIVPVGVQGLMINTGPDNVLTQVDVSVGDILHVLDTVTRVVGVVSALIGMFA